MQLVDSLRNHPVAGGQPAREEAADEQPGQQRRPFDAHKPRLRPCQRHQIAAGASITTTWRVEAVNHGSFGVYVAVLPESGVARPPAISPTVHLLVAQKKTLNSGEIVPLALGMPGLLGLPALSLRRGRGRSGRLRA